MLWSLEVAEKIVVLERRRNEEQGVKGHDPGKVAPPSMAEHLP